MNMEKELGDWFLLFWRVSVLFSCYIEAERVRYFKEEQEGVATMSRVFEEVAREAAWKAARETSVETARMLLSLGKLSYEEIAKSVRLLTVDEVKALDEGKPA